MTSAIRHGAEVHVVRPDRVYRTSVIVPFVGYSPQADVQAVARQFTTGGPLATTLSGLGQPGFFQRLILQFKARRAAKQAAKFMAGYGQPWHAGYGQPWHAGFGHPGIDPSASLIVGNQVAPQMQAQMSMLETLTQGRNPLHMQGAVSHGAWVHSHRRPYTFYRAG